MASSIRVIAILSKMAKRLDLAHGQNAPEACVITPRFSQAVSFTLCDPKSSVPSNVLHEDSVYAVHGFMKCDWRWVDDVQSARTRGFRVIEGIDPSYLRQPARLCESFVDVLVVEIMYAFTTNISFRAVVPWRVHRTRTNSFDRIPNFLFEELHFFFTFSLCLFPSFTTSIGTFVGFSACGHGSNDIGRRVGRWRSLHELVEVVS